MKTWQLHMDRLKKITENLKGLFFPPCESVNSIYIIKSKNSFGMHYVKFNWKTVGCSVLIKTGAADMEW